MTSSPLSRSLPNLTVIHPQTITEAGDAIRAAAAAGQGVLVRGGGTKWSAGSIPDNQSIILETGALSGISEYDPGELTITAGAGTPLNEAVEALGKHGQYLPFDPLFVDRDLNATLGGTVGAGLSGPRRLRYGGLRDFIIGIHYLNADGTPVHAGGKVVKNAAGYDFSKLFCGSLGTLGVLTQVSFKVFPQPQASETLIAGLNAATDVQRFFQAALRSKVEISAAEAWQTSITLSSFVPAPFAFLVAVQVDGARESLGTRLDALQKLLPAGAEPRRITGIDEFAVWAMFRDLVWIKDELKQTILRLYLTPDRLAALDAYLRAEGAQVVYSLGGNAGWATLPSDPARLAASLRELGVRATVWRSSNSNTTAEIIPELPGEAMLRRVKQAFDPSHVFYPGRYAVS